MTPEDGRRMLLALRKEAEEYLIKALRDRGDGLFFGVPREGAEAPRGYRIEKREAGVALYPLPELLETARAYAGEGSTELTRLMETMRGRAAGEDEMRLWSEGVKRLGERTGAREIARDEKKVRQTAAACMRRGGGGAMWACAMCLEAVGGKEERKVRI